MHNVCRKMLKLNEGKSANEIHDQLDFGGVNNDGNVDADETR